jgi:hypothetical protein
MGSASDAVKGAVGEAALERVEAAKVAAGQVAQNAKSAAERAGLTPAAAADAAGSIGGKVKRDARADGEGPGKVRLLQSMPGSRRRRGIWPVLGYAALGVLALARRDPSRRVGSGRCRARVDTSGMETSGEDHPQPEIRRASQPDHGRHADTPADIPMRGWRDILLRVYNNISKDRVITIAAGVTCYSLLAVFPAIAALVAIYGLFADPAIISRNLDSLSGLLPEGAIDVISDQMARIASRGNGTLGLTFGIGLLVSLWSANAGIKSLFDALNLVYNEEEERGLIRLNLVSLTFTVAAIVFGLVGLAAVVVLPVALNYIGLGGATDLIIRIGRWPILFLLVAVALAFVYRIETEMALDNVGQRFCCSGLDCGVDSFLLVRRQFRQLQPDVRLAWGRCRPHDLAMAVDDHHPGRRRA